MNCWPPWILYLRMKGNGLPSLRLWLPLFLIWPIVVLLLVILSPLILFLLAAGFVMFSIQLNPFELFWRLYLVVCSLKGLKVEVETHGDQSIIEIYFR
jgi:hypothetical protein